MVAVALWHAFPLAAQTPAKPDPAVEAAAAMERAKRQAAGPMRIILEASKARRKPGEGDPPPITPSNSAAAAPDAGGVRSVANRTPTPVAAANPSANPAQPTAPPPALAATPVPTANNASPPATAAPGQAGGVSTQVTLEAGALGAKPAASAVSGLQSTTNTGPIVAPLAAAPRVTVPTMQASDLVRLLSVVEPEVPQRVLDEMGRNATIQVDLLLRTDGSVASVNLVTPAPRGLLRVLTPSLEQWKFAPLTAQRTHRVELLFNAER